jgi:hypothetical protein
MNIQTKITLSLILSSAAFIAFDTFAAEDEEKDPRLQTLECIAGTASTDATDECEDINISDFITTYTSEEFTSTQLKSYSYAIDTTPIPKDFEIEINSPIEGLKFSLDCNAIMDEMLAGDYVNNYEITPSKLEQLTCVDADGQETIVSHQATEQTTEIPDEAPLTQSDIQASYQYDFSTQSIHAICLEVEWSSFTYESIDLYECLDEHTDEGDDQSPNTEADSTAATSQAASTIREHRSYLKSSGYVEGYYSPSDVYNIYKRQQVRLEMTGYNSDIVNITVTETESVQLAAVVGQEEILVPIASSDITFFVPVIQDIYKDAQVRSEENIIENLSADSFISRPELILSCSNFSHVEELDTADFKFLRKYSDGDADNVHYNIITNCENSFIVTLANFGVISGEATLEISKRYDGEIYLWQDYADIITNDLVHAFELFTTINDANNKSETMEASIARLTRDTLYENITRFVEIQNDLSENDLYYTEIRDDLIVTYFNESGTVFTPGATLPTWFYEVDDTLAYWASAVTSPTVMSFSTIQYLTNALNSGVDFGTLLTAQQIELDSQRVKANAFLILINDYNTNSEIELDEIVTQIEELLKDNSN